MKGIEYWIDDVRIDFVKVYRDGSFSKADNKSIEMLARALVEAEFGKVEDIPEFVQKKITEKNIDFKGFDYGEIKKIIQLGSDITPYATIELRFPTGREENILLRPCELQEFTKQEFEIYNRLYNELTKIRDEIVVRAKEQYDKIKKEKYKENAIKEYERLKKKYEDIEEKYYKILDRYSVLVEFIKERGLQNDFAEFLVRKLREEIESEWSDIFD